MQAFAECDEMLRKSGLMIGAAEAHGMITGFMCASKPAESAQWLKDMFASHYENGDVPEAAFRVLAAIAGFTQDQLDDDALTFQPMAPDENDGFSEQSRELCKWSSGLLYGLAQAGLDDKTATSSSIAGTLSDLANIARELGGIGDYADDEDDQGDLQEIREYLRMIPLSLVAELQTEDTAPEIH